VIALQLSTQPCNACMPPRRFSRLLTCVEAKQHTIGVRVVHHRLHAVRETGQIGVDLARRITPSSLRGSPFSSDIQV
jgi:hypothetical protein